MEDRMDVPGGWEGEDDIVGREDLGNGKRSKPLPVQLLDRPVRLDVLSLEIHLVPHLVGRWLLGPSVVVGGHVLGRSLEGRLGLVLCSLPLSDEVVGGLVGCGTPWFDSHARILASVQLEGGVARARVDMVVVGKLTDGGPLGPVILAMVDKGPKVLLNLLVDSLCLNICLRMVGSRWRSLDV